MAFTCREIDRSSRRFVAAEAGGRRAESPESPYRPSDVDNLIGASRRSSFSLFFFFSFFHFLCLFLFLSEGVRVFAVFFFRRFGCSFFSFRLPKKKKRKKRKKKRSHRSCRSVRHLGRNQIEKESDPIPIT